MKNHIIHTLILSLLALASSCATSHTITTWGPTTDSNANSFEQFVSLSKQINESLDLVLRDPLIPNDRNRPPLRFADRKRNSQVPKWLSVVYDVEHSEITLIYSVSEKTNPEAVEKIRDVIEKIIAEVPFGSDWHVITDNETKQAYL